MTRTERRLQEQSDLERIARKVRNAPRGSINAWRRWQVREVARMMRKELKNV